MLICFNGIDGSGKTLQALRLKAHLNEKGYSVHYVWGGGRTPLTLPFVRFAKRLLKAPRLAPRHRATNEMSAQYQNYLSATKKILGTSWIFSIWLHLTLIEHLLKLWVIGIPCLQRKHIVICDRYIYDSVINTAFLAGLESSRLPSWLRHPYLSTLPKPAKTFFLDVPAEVAFHRKNDIVALPEIEQQIPLYRIAAETLNMFTIDATVPADDIASIIWKEIEPLLCE